MPKMCVVAAAAAVPFMGMHSMTERDCTALASQPKPANPIMAKRTNIPLRTVNPIQQLRLICSVL